MRQRSGLLEHAPPWRAIGERVGVPCSSHSAACGHRSSGRSPRVKSASLQPRGRALTGDLEHLVGREVGRRQPTGHGRNDAVVAAVAAQPGERDEHSAGVGDDAGASGGLEPLVAGTRPRCSMSVVRSSPRASSSAATSGTIERLPSRARARAAHGLPRRGGHASLLPPTSGRQHRTRERVGRSCPQHDRLGPTVGVDARLVGADPVAVERVHRGPRW